MLGHEIAHNIAHHAAERLSIAALMISLPYLIMFLTGFSGGLVDMALQLAWQMPMSRKQEVKDSFPARQTEGCGVLTHFYQSEADLIGLSSSMPFDHGLSASTNIKAVMMSKACFDPEAALGLCVWPFGLRFAQES